MSASERMRLVPDAPYLPERGAQPREVNTRVLAALAVKPWLTPTEAALYLSCPTVNALRRRKEKGVIPPWCWTKFGGSLRFSRAALDELLEEQLSRRPAVRSLAIKR